MSVILFVDMLGARKKWQTGGVPSAVESFNHFSRLVIAALREESPDTIVRGAIETDSAMIVFDSPIPAFNAARRLFRYAFTNQRNPSAPRLWLRGSMVPDGSNEYIRRGTHMSGKFEHVDIFTYSNEALDAVSIEKSGFKGMRLIVRESLITRQIMSHFGLQFDDTLMIPFKRLRYSGYPPQKDDLRDYLWMACADAAEWDDISLHMTYRLRHSANDQDEFAQAAATQVLFHECAALRMNAIGRGKRILNEKANNGLVRTGDPRTARQSAQP